MSFITTRIIMKTMSSDEIIVLVAVILLCVLIAYIFFSVLFYFTYRYYTNEEYQNCKSLLNLEFAFFSFLNESQKHSFVKRTLFISRKKQFIPRDGMYMGFDVKILISATIAKITFGMYNNYWMGMYETIVVYPQKFYSRFLDTYVKGLTSARGLVLLSWEDFMDGIRNTTDKINLGVHEFAHAFYFNYIHDNGNNSAYTAYRREAQDIFNDMKANLSHKSFYFRDYATANEHEFWAVSIEHFFENPFGFKKVYPQLYTFLSRVLQIDLVQLIRINNPRLALKLHDEAEQMKLG